MITLMIAAPKTVDFNVNGLCNLDCSRCWGPAHSKLIETLETEDRNKLTTKLKGYGTEKIIISGGEPLLKIGLYDIIYHIKEELMRVTLSTNGILLDKNMHIAELADDIGIPLDGYTPESSEIMRKGSRKSFGRLIDNIKRIQDKYPEKDFTIRTVVTNQNKDIITDIGNFLLQQGILSPTVRWKIYECASYGPRTEEIRNGKWKIPESSFDDIAEKIKNKFPNQKVFFQKQKNSIRRYIIINPDGNIKIVEGDGIESFVGHISHIEKVLLDNNIVNNVNHG